MSENEKSLKKQRCHQHLIREWAEAEDKLSGLIQAQRSYIIELHDIDSMDGSQRTELTLKILQAIAHELAELREWLPWKYWKKYSKHFNYEIDEIRFEIADIVCFVLDLALIWGMNEQDIHDYTMSKISLNMKRQNDSEYGYV